MGKFKLVESIMTKNPCYTAGRKIDVKGFMLHSVGCSQPSAMAFINNWNKSSYDRACVHGFIDANDGTQYQTLPWNHRGWHAGGSANNTHIGVEMCEPDCIKYTGGTSFTCSNIDRAKDMVKRTYESAVELCAMLCKQYNLNPLQAGVIVSHKEGCARGIASNHGDPEHLWKGLGLVYTMDTFRKDVKAMMEGSAEENVDNDTIYRVQVGAYSSKKNADTQLNKVKSAGFNDAFITQVDGLYKVQVGAYKVKSNADNMLVNIKSKGFDAFITTKGGTKVQNTPSKKSVNEVAKEVIQGKWGNGDARKSKLEAAGYNYAEVQSEVNRLLR